MFNLFNKKYDKTYNYRVVERITKKEHGVTRTYTIEVFDKKWKPYKTKAIDVIRVDRDAGGDGYHTGLIKANFYQVKYKTEEDARYWLNKSFEKTEHNYKGYIIEELYHDAEANLGGMSSYSYYKYKTVYLCKKINKGRSLFKALKDVIDCLESMGYIEYTTEKTTNVNFTGAVAKI